MKKGYLIYLMSALAIIALAIVFARGDFLPFFDAPCIMLVFAPTVLMLLSHYSPSEIVHVFRTAMKGSESDRDELMDAYNFFDEAQRLMYTIALLAFILGVALMLLSYSDKNPQMITGEQFSRGLVTSVICIIYAMITVMLVTIPFKGAIQRKINRA